jgi:hypothetical protein
LDAWATLDPSRLFPEEISQASIHRHYLVYLDGIHQSEECHPPKVTEFLECLDGAIAEDTLLVKGIEAYTITNVGLRSTTFAGWFWQRLFSLQEHHPNGLVRLICAFSVQANNVIKVGISFGSSLWAGNELRTGAEDRPSSWS